MILIIQEIQTTWTKASRGGPGAARRNAVPDALPLPLPAIRSGAQPAVLHHRARFEERAGFEDPREELLVDPALPLDAGCVTVRWEDGGAEVEFYYRWECAGAPERSPRRRRMAIGPCERGRVTYNGRFSDSDGFWYYSKFVMNLGLFEVPVADVFTQGGPNAEIQAMALLR